MNEFLREHIDDKESIARVAQLSLALFALGVLASLVNLVRLCGGARARAATLLVPVLLASGAGFVLFDRLPPLVDAQV